MADNFTEDSKIQQIAEAYASDAIDFAKERKQPAPNPIKSTCAKEIVVGALARNLTMRSSGLRGRDGSISKSSVVHAGATGRSAVMKTGFVLVSDGGDFLDCGVEAGAEAGELSALWNAQQGKPCAIVRLLHNPWHKKPQDMHDGVSSTFGGLG